MAVYRSTYIDKKTNKKRQQRVWWYSFVFQGRRVQESSGSTRKTVAMESEKRRRLELEQGFNGIADNRRDRLRTLGKVAEEFLESYSLRNPRSAVFATYAVGHVARLLGRTLVVAVTDATVKLYQDARLKEKASAKSINEETGFLLRMLDEQGDILRAKLRREHALKLQVDEPVAKAFGSEEKARLLAAAKARRSPHIYPALMLNLHAGLRDGEIRGLQWGRIDLVKAVLVVGKAKTLAGQGRAVPLNSDVLRALTEHAQWYLKKFGETKPEWYVFPAGQPQPTDPTRPVSSFKTAWAEVKMAAEITGRWHDGRHSYITALAESGEASDETIRQLAGHVSKQMLARYSHIGMEAKRRAVAALEVKPARSETEQNAVGVVKVSTKVELVN